MDNGEMQGRREFIKSGLAAAAVPALAGAGLVTGLVTGGGSPAVAAEPAGTPPTSNGIPMRPFGKTGRTLPILGMGGSAMVQLFNSAYGVPLLPLEERVAMVRHAYDSGIRYFDTARVYGESEQIVGRGLQGVRQHCYVATKCHTPDPAQVRPLVEKSLSELGMDYVDCIQLHSPAIERAGVAGARKIHAELVKLRDEKMCRFIGLTTHVVFEDVYALMGDGGFDQVLLAYGYFRKGMDTMLSNRKLEYRDLCLARAHELGMAIVAMKVLGANIFSHNSTNLVPDFDEQRREKIAPAAIRWVLTDDRVSLLNIGVSMPSDVDKNVAVLRGNTELTNDDRELLADFAAKAYQSQLIQELKVT